MLYLLIISIYLLLKINFIITHVCILVTVLQLIEFLTAFILSQNELDFYYFIANEKLKHPGNVRYWKMDSNNWNDYLNRIENDKASKDESS